MRFFLLDKITKLKIEESAEGIKCWTMSEDFFNEHFPGHPIVPGVLLTESMAQLLGFLISKSYQQVYSVSHEIYAILTIIHKAKFMDIVVPGSLCVIKAALTSIDLERASGKTEIFVENNLVAEANLSFAISSEKDYPKQKTTKLSIMDYYDIISTNMKIAP